MREADIEMILQRANISTDGAFFIKVDCFRLSPSFTANRREAIWSKFPDPDFGTK
jgi:hypothetical protein